jgi:antitoxin component HigA of HigAB toxin-antitoxin module
LEVMTVEPGYVELLIAHQPVKPRDRQELAELTALLETLAANEQKQNPAMERFIETLTALVMQYEDEIEPDPEQSPSGVLKYLMEELGSKSYVSQVLSGHRPIVRKPPTNSRPSFGQRLQLPVGG